MIIYGLEAFYIIDWGSILCNNQHKGIEGAGKEDTWE